MQKCLRILANKKNHLKSKFFFSKFQNWNSLPCSHYSAPPLYLFWKILSFWPLSYKRNWYDSVQHFQEIVIHAMIFFFNSKPWFSTILFFHFQSCIHITYFKEKKLRDKQKVAEKNKEEDVSKYFIIISLCFAIFFRHKIIWFSRISYLLKQ